TFSVLLLGSSALAAPSNTATLGQPLTTKAPAKAPPHKTPAHTNTPIAGILDGSNGETINVHGHHAADGTAAKYMNKIVYLG
ncbi:MAG: TonB-dependent siderophore receptor, partial [Acetobacter orientalis]